MEPKASFSIPGLFTRHAGAPFLMPILIAILVGVLSGGTAVAYIKLIDAFSFFFLEFCPRYLGPFAKYSMVIIPAFGGLLVGLWIYRVVPQGQGQGVPETLKAITLQHGKMDLMVIPGKVVGTALSLGSGASVGREGPIVQIGATIGSNIAKLFKLGELKTRNLIACGTAAGISTVFNAPITGVMYSLEMILRDFGARALGTVVIASVTASVICRIFLGAAPAFAAPSSFLASPFEMFIYIFLGALSGLTAVALNWTIHKTSPLLKKLRLAPWLKPAIGGLIIGIMALWVPHVLGTGFDLVNKVLHDAPFAWKLLLLFALSKIISSAISLGSGNPGGLFGPTLFIGAMLGAAVGQLVRHHVPFSTASPGAYALVGMASVFAGAAHAPLTAMFLVFELTGNYRMVLPVMTAVVLATYISQFIHKYSLDAIELMEHGADLETWEEMKILGGLEVRNAMTQSFEIIPNRLEAKKVAEKILKHKNKLLFLKNSRGEITGMITPEYLQELFLEEGIAGIIAEDIATPLTAVCHPEEPLAEAAQMMISNQIRYLPVLNARNANEIMGVLHSEDVFLAYTKLAANRSLMEK